MSVGVEEIAQRYDSESQYRRLSGVPGAVAAALAAILSLFHLYTAGAGPLEALRQRSLHLALIMTLAFLLYPATRKSNRRAPTLWDWALAGASALTVGYLWYNYEAFIRRNGVVLPWELWVGAAGILLLLEAGRRVLGKELLILAAIFLAYAYFGRWLPGIFGHRGYGVARIIEHMFFGTEGIFGIALSVSATYMYLFILMGALLAETGLSQLINGVALRLTGRSPGGPAKVSVMASAFLGMLSGSAVANAASSGPFTIPMMKRAGYSGTFAAAVEGASSTGGQIMPPIMGAAAFLVAEFLGIPYGQVVVAAAIPALLYYLSLWIMVHLEARRLGLRGLQRHELPSLRTVLREKGHLALPVLLMVYLLVRNYTPLFAGYWAIVSTFAVAWLWEEGRALAGGAANLRQRWYVLLPGAAFLAAWLGLGQDPSVSVFWALLAAFLIALINPRASESLAALRTSLINGARNAVGVALATAIVGFVVGSASLTSLGLNLGSYIVRFSGDNVLLALFLTMLTSIVVGTGVPTTPTYIIVALVAAPALIRMGIPPLAAHLFVFYYGALADVTPPTALSSYTAAGIAGTDPQKTTWIAWKLALAGFIIPYYFAMNPILLLNVVPAAPREILLALASAAVGVICLSMALQGYVLKPANWLERGGLLASSLLLMQPGILTDLIGLAGLLGVLAAQKLRQQSAPPVSLG